jgi:hypothetical protein
MGDCHHLRAKGESTLNFIHATSCCRLSPVPAIWLSLRLTLAARAQRLPGESLRSGELVSHPRGKLL